MERVVGQAKSVLEEEEGQMWERRRDLQVFEYN